MAVTASTPQEVRAAVQQYVDGCRDADPELVRDAFGESAVMWGYLGPEFVSMSGSEFADRVVATAAPATADYVAEITVTSIQGDIAHAVLEERGFLGGDFHNEFGLVRVDGRWRIFSKVFTTLPPVSE